MGSEWVEKSLGDLIDIRHGFAFKGDFFRDQPQGDILLTPGNFAIGGGFKADKLKYYDGPVSDEFVLREGDLIVTMTDLSKNADTLGYPAFIPPSSGGHRFLHNQRLGKVVAKDTKTLDLRYLFYLMCSCEYRHEVIASATGTTVKHTSPERIKRFHFRLPPLPEQRAIAHILGTLDDKVELNRRMNATLEAMARAIFKSWFVDFEPVHAKARGEQPAGMDAETAALFPDSFEESELGMIPCGWRVGALDNAIEIISGGTPKTSVPEYWDGDIYWFSVKDVPRDGDVFVVETEKTITRAGVEHSSAKILPEGTSIVTARGTVGKLALVGVPMAMNQSCYGIRGIEDNSDYYTFFLLKSAVGALQKNTHGTVFDTITRKTFSAIRVIIPPVEIIQAFDILIDPLLGQIKRNLFESGTLGELRDASLPKLISGKVRVGENTS